MYVTACDLEKSFTFDNKFQITSCVRFLIYAIYACTYENKASCLIAHYENKIHQYMEAQFQIERINIHSWISVSYELSHVEWVTCIVVARYACTAGTSVCRPVLKWTRRCLDWTTATDHSTHLLAQTARRRTLHTDNRRWCQSLTSEYSQVNLRLSYA